VTIAYFEIFEPNDCAVACVPLNVERVDVWLAEQGHTFISWAVAVEAKISIIIAAGVQARTYLPLVARLQLVHVLREGHRELRRLPVLGLVLCRHGIVVERTLAVVSEVFAELPRLESPVDN